MVLADATAQLDTRSVSLSRSGAINEWTTNDGGTSVTHGDTTYTPIIIPQFALGESPEPNRVSFNSSLSGDWSTSLFTYGSDGYNVTWNWITDGAGLESGGADVTEFKHLLRVTPEGNLKKKVGIFGSEEWITDGNTPKAPMSATVKYFVRDNVDDAEAEARYELTVHEPIEKVTDDTESLSHGPFPLFDGNGNLVHTPIVPIGGTTVPAGSYYFEKSGTIGSSTGWAVGVGVSFPEIAKLFGAPVDVGANGEYHWDNSIDQTGTRGITTPWPLTEGQGAYVTYSVAYNQHSVKYRWFQKQGENKRPGSPLPVAGQGAPGPSIPWEWRWQVKIGPTISYALLDTNMGQTWPENPGNPNVVLPSANLS